MKKIVLFALMLVALASCKNETGYVINGDATGFEDGTVVRLLQRVKPDWITIDSAVVKDGAFVIEGQVDPGFMAYVEVGDESNRFSFILEPGNITVNVADRRAKGTPSNDKYAAFLDETDAMDAEEEALFAAMDSVTNDSIKSIYSQKIDSIDRIYVDKIKACMAGNITNPLGIGLFTTYSSIFADDIQMLLDLSNKVPEKYRVQQPVQATINMINTISRTSVGSQYVDFAFNTVDGRETSLAECVNNNRYVLIDFWASWCAPCRASLPGIKALNDQFGDKGLCIIGVSLDKEQEAWLNAISNFQMTWLQTSSLHYWDDEIAALYGVRAIPSTVLIDSNGTIIDRNVDIEELSAKLAAELTEK